MDNQDLKQKANGAFSGGAHMIQKSGQTFHARLPSYSSIAAHYRADYGTSCECNNYGEECKLIDELKFVPHSRLPSILQMNINFTPEYFESDGEVKTGVPKLSYFAAKSVKQVVDEDLRIPSVLTERFVRIIHPRCFMYNGDLIPVVQGPAPISVQAGCSGGVAHQQGPCAIYPPYDPEEPRVPD